MSEKIFVGWVKVKEVQGKNGPWQYTQISFKDEDLEKLAQYKNEKGYVNLKLNRSQKGSEYLEIDTFGLNNNPAPAPQVQEPKPFEAPPMDEGSLDVPFNRLGDFDQ